MTSQTDSCRANLENTERSESQTQQHRRLADARQKARECGLSPVERSAQKTSAALSWLYRWEWSAPATLDVVASDTRGGYAQRLKRAGLVRITEVIGSPGTRHRPRYAITLTPAGRQGAMEVLTEESQLRPLVKMGLRAIPMHQIEHEHRLQLLVLDWLRDGTITDYLTPPELAARSQPGEKQPDLIIWGGMVPCRIAVDSSSQPNRRWRPRSLSAAACAG